jgi:peptidyl-prolyl cis-trans isomerase B (cyclophilin B)
MPIDPQRARPAGRQLRQAGRVATQLALALLLAACSADTDRSSAAASATAGLPRADVNDGPHDVAVLEVKDLGTIRFELLPEVAPQTVEHFVKLTEQGLYDGTTFHRVIPGFMIQGGDPNSRDKDPRNDGRGGPGFRIGDEFTDFPHLRGVVAMANSGAPNSAGSQFFIVQQDTPDLDGRYTVFGVVIEGLEVVDAITNLEIDEFGRYGPPERPYPISAVMEKVRIEPAG